MRHAVRCAAIALLVLATTGCEKQDVLPTAPDAPEDVQPSPSSVGAVVAIVNSSARVLVVDRDGRPLAGMTPIVTVQPNAFDEPLARGAATDAAGHASIAFPGDQDLCLRAWDATQRYFPSNYYTVLAGGGTVADRVVLQMVEASAVAVQVFLLGDRPAADLEIGLMLYHATEGPWWPASGRTDGQGMVRFAPVPAGRYTFRLRTENDYGVELSEAFLPPGGEALLGTVVAHPLPNSKNSNGRE